MLEAVTVGSPVSAHHRATVAAAAHIRKQAAAATPKLEAADMRCRRAKQSNGTTGEREFERWSGLNGWVMFRHTPSTRVVYGSSGPKIVFVEKATPDYTGFLAISYAYRAVEVKEASGDTMPCSRLTKRQRERMKALPEGLGFVAVCWMDGSRNGIEIFCFKEAGSYKRSEGSWSRS